MLATLEPFIVSHFDPFATTGDYSRHIFYVRISDIGDFSKIMRMYSSMASLSFLRHQHVSHDHPLKTMFKAPITQRKHVLTGDGQQISTMG